MFKPETVMDILRHYKNHGFEFRDIETCPDKDGLYITYLHKYRKPGVRFFLSSRDILEYSAITILEIESDLVERIKNAIRERKYV